MVSWQRERPFATIFDFFDDSMFYPIFQYHVVKPVTLSRSRLYIEQYNAKSMLHGKSVLDCTVFIKHYTLLPLPYYTNKLS
jgi:hypothetical protein